MSKLALIPTTRAQANAEVVEQLESMLALARKGKMLALAAAWTDNETGCCTYFSKSENGIQLLGAISRLSHRYNLSFDRD